MKGSGRGEDGVRTTRQAWLLPADAEFPAYFEQNLRRKSATLGLGDDVRLDAITAVGPKRSFAVKGGKKVGATIQVDLVGDPAILRALKADPRIAAGPVVLAAADVTTLLFYFGLGTRFLS